MPKLTPVLPFKKTTPTIENTPCFVINLDSEPEKFSATKTVLRSIGFVSERFPAVVGKDLDLSTVPELTKYARKFLEPGTIGCFMSHRKVWQKIADSEVEYALITEDDLFLDLPAAYVRKYIATALTELPVAWDVLYLGHFGLTGSPTEVSTLLTTMIWSNPSMPKREYSRVSERLNTPAFPVGAHAYMVSYKGCRKLLKTLTAIDTHVDLTMARAYSRGIWGVYALERRMIHQYSIHSGTISGGKFFGNLAKIFSARDPLVYEPSLEASLNFSSGTLFNWKALSILTGITAVTAVIIGAVTVNRNYALVGCGFLLLNCIDFIDGFGWSKVTVILANTVVCLVCGLIGRVIGRNLDRSR